MTERYYEIKCNLGVSAQHLQECAWGQLMDGLLGGFGSGCAADYYIGYDCQRCGSLFYVHAAQNYDPFSDVLCPWCRGECSAAAQDHFNELIQATKRTIG